MIDSLQNMKESQIKKNKEVEQIQMEVKEYDTSDTQTAEGIQNQEIPSEDEILNESQELEKRENEDKPLSLEETAWMDSDDVYVVTNLLDPLILVNKTRNLPSGYVPSDLVEPIVPFSFQEKLPKRLMRKEAATALEELFEKAAEDEIELLGQSAYRSYNTQDAIFAYNAKHHGEEEANRSSALPGHSEHQTGLAIDITSRSVGLALNESFGETSEGIWVKENAAQFGFIIRYPMNKEEITGYIYEPWHIRYVGKEAAMDIYENNLTLEEYLYSDEGYRGFFVGISINFKGRI